MFELFITTAIAFGGVLVGCAAGFVICMLLLNGMYMAMDYIFNAIEDRRKK